MMLACVSAICLLAAASAPVSSSFDSIIRQANAARDAGQNQKALTLYSEAVQRNPGQPEGWWLLGTLLYEEQRFGEAGAALRHLVGPGSKPSAGYALLALCEYETHDYEAAVKHLAQWADAKPSTAPPLAEDAFLHWALLRNRAGQFEQALALLKAQVKQGHNGPILVEGLGLACLRIPALPTDYPPGDRELIWIAGRAELAATRHHLQEAEAIAQELLPHYSNHPNVPYFLGNVFLEANEEGRAEEYFRQELALSPVHVPALVQVASAELQAGNTTDALELARRAVATAPNDFIPHAILGKALLAMGKKEDSVRELEKARDLQPRSVDVHWSLSRAYMASGRQSDSLRERKTVEELKAQQQGQIAK